jgi:hypothetical protein
VLSAVDKELQRKHNGLRAYRYIDDYEFAVDQTAHSDLLLGSLQECLNEYELSLNPRKTFILQLPQGIDSPWVHQLRRFQFRANARAQRSDLLQYLDLVFELAQEFEDAHVVKYALARFYPERGFRWVDRQNWPLLQSLVCQAITVQPGALPEGIRVLLEHIATGHAPDRDLIERTLSNIIKRHARLGHASEVAWAIWGTMVFQNELDATARAAIAVLDDSVVALLALDAAERGLVDPVSLDVTKWQEHVNGEGLYGPQWLLAYEATVKDWLSSASGDHIGSDEAFSFLREGNVSFYARVPTVLAEALATLSGYSGTGISGDSVVISEFDGPDT